MTPPATSDTQAIFIDQSTLFADAKTLQKIMDWMDTPATQAETDGMRRILQSKAPWHRG